MKTLTTAYQPDAFRKEAHALVETLADYLESLHASPATVSAIPYQTPDAAYTFWKNDYEKGGSEADIQSFFREVIQQSVHLHHPKYMGHQVCPPLPLAATASLLSAFLNNGMAVYEMGMVSNPLERIISELLAKKVGYGEQAGGFLTSGGTLANVTALLAARAAKTDAWEAGTTQKVGFMVSEESHYSIDRAVRIMGMGAEGCIKVPTNEQFQLKTDLLEEYLQTARQQGIKVIGIVGSACSTATGSYDDLLAISDFAKKHNLWFHVDAAHGGAVVFSEKYQSLVKGIEKADSVIIDWHKLLMTPALATSVLFKNGVDGYGTFQQKAQYLWENQAAGEWYNSGKQTFECTKLMMSVKIYSLIKAYGETIFSENVTYLYDMAQGFYQRLQNNPAFEVATPPQSNIVCFRWVGGEADTLNEINARIRQNLLEDGSFYVVQTTIHGKTFLRVSLMNPLTTESDLEQLMEKIENLTPKNQ